MRKVILFAAGIAHLALPLSTLVAQSRPPLPTPENSRGPGRDLQADDFVKTYNISPEEAAERVSILQEVQQIVQLATADDEESFGGVWVDHSPVFKIIVAFSGTDTRAAFLNKVSPRLRRYIQVRASAKSLKEAQQEVQLLMQALSRAGITFETYFEPRRQNHIVSVKSQADADIARRLIPPALRPNVNVEVGGPSGNFQANVQTGDAVYGGWSLFDSGGKETCTYGFVGRDSSGRNSILTAGHCRTNPPYVIGADANHFVQLPYAEPQYGDQFDFRHHPVVGLSTGYWVYFLNSQPVVGYTQYVNTVPGFYSDGYFTVRDRVQYTAWNSNHYVGMRVCKNGFRTGFTCGSVEANWVSGVDSRGVSYTGFVRVSGSSQAVIAFEGDSGAPVFSYPNSAYEIDAVGVLKGGASGPNGGPCSGSTCWYSYMPLDRVNDKLPFMLHTTKGFLMP